MNQHPYVLAVIRGVLHVCPIAEGISAMLECGFMPWKPVRKCADPAFLREAAEIIREPYELED